MHGEELGAVLALASDTSGRRARRRHRLPSAHLLRRQPKRERHALVFTAVAGAQQHVKSGKLMAIAVSSGRRSGSLPEVPTFVESGVPDFVVS